MDNFVVSARKYRPTGFEEVVGQEHITTTLKNAIDSKHLAQALLFCGPRGVGKTTCARIVARMINDSDSIDSNASLNIFELDAASNNSVDHIRNLTDQVRYPPQYGNYKVYIIDEVHMLSNTAFNAFLKTLEEPPPYAIFILATTEKHKVIPTILSRCQIYDFNRISISDIADHLKEIAEKEGVKAEDEALHLIAAKADGALRDALSLFDLIVTFSSDNSITYQSTIDNLHILDYDYYFKMTDNLINENISASLLLFDEILKKGFDGHNFIVGLSLHFRNLMVCKDEASLDLLEVAANVRTKYNEQANNASMSFLLSAINISSHCDIQYKASKNSRLLVELALMKMAHVSSIVDPSKLASDQNDGAKKKTEIETQDEPEKEKPEVSSDPPSPKVSIPDTEKEIAGIKKKEVGITTQPSSKNLKSTTRIPSLDALKEVTAKKKSTSETTTELDEQEETDEKIKEPIDEEHLRSLWDEFKLSKKESGNSRELTVLNQPMDIDKNIISLSLTNSIQLDILEELKSELLIFLKKALDNKTITIEGILKKESNEETKLYTNKEKFEFLAEKNSTVKELQEKFGLDPDF